MTSERYTTGLDMLQRVDGKGGDAVVKSRPSPRTLPAT